MRTLAFSITEYQTGIICEYQVVCFIDLCTRPYSALYALLSLIQFTFWSCISSSTVCFVTITSSASVRSFCILTSQTFYPPKVFAVIRAKSASQSRVLHKHLSQVSSCLSLPPHDATIECPLWFVETPPFWGDTCVFVISLWQVTVPAICACGFSPPCHICLAPC